MSKKITTLTIPQYRTKELLGIDDIELKVFFKDITDNDDIKEIRKKFEGSILWEIGNQLCVVIKKMRR